MWFALKRRYFDFNFEWKKVSFDDFLVTTWQREDKSQRKKEPQIPYPSDLSFFNFKLFYWQNFSGKEICPRKKMPTCANLALVNPPDGKLVNLTPVQCAMMQYFLWQGLLILMPYNEKKNLLKIYKIDCCALSDPFQILSNQFSISRNQLDCKSSDILLITCT